MLLVRILCLAILFYQFSVVVSQNRPLIELSTPLGPHFILSDDGEMGLSFNTSINYVFNPRFTAGIMLVYEELPSYHDMVDFRRDTKSGPYSLREVGDEIDIYVSTGIGINAKYNFIMNSYFNVYAQVQANYVSLSIGGDMSATLDKLKDEREWTSPDEKSTYISGPLPFEGQQTVSLNLNVGADFKVNRWFSFYVQYDMRDLLNNLNLNYTVEVYSDDPLIVSNDPFIITDVQFNESSGNANVRTLHLGLRFYMFDRKY